MAAEPRLGSAPPAELSIHLAPIYFRSSKVDRAVAPIRLGPRYLPRIMTQALPLQTASALHASLRRIPRSFSC